ncbi:MAG: helix-turn-helix domain-containing protein [Vulcanimicrobiaceae bacterium]
MEHATVGSRIRHYRRAKGLSAAALATRAGVTENAIRKIESGDSKEPRFSTGVRIARALDIEPDVIVGDVASGSKQSRPELAAVLRQIRVCREELAREGVAHVLVFGSVARGDANAQSDVDIIVQPAPSARFSLLNLSAASDILHRALSRRVDVVTERSICRAPFAQTVQDEAVHAF